MLAYPMPSATALTLATSVFGDDSAALKLAVRASTLEARTRLIGDPAASESQRLAEVSAWALGSLIKQVCTDHLGGN